MHAAPAREALQVSLGGEGQARGRPFHTSGVEMEQNSEMITDSLSDSPHLHQKSSMAAISFAMPTKWGTGFVSSSTSVMLHYSVLGFFATINDSSWTINLCMLVLFSARAACSIIFLSLLTVTATHLSPPSQQLLIFSSRLTEWRCQSRKGQTASPSRSASRKNTSSHRWDKLVGISREVTPRWFCSKFYKVTRKNPLD